MYSRICIFGRPGSGKSTFALKLHSVTGIPLYHLDKYFYTSNWVERNYQEFLAIERDIVKQNQWIIDGNCLQSLEVRYARADLCLYFNYPRWLCLIRLIKRYFVKDTAIKDRAEGCQESLKWSLLRYMWTFETRCNSRFIHHLASLRANYPQVQFIEICDSNDLNKASKLLGL